MPILGRTAATKVSPVRIVNVSSDAHSMGPKDGILFDDLGEANGNTMFVDPFWRRTLVSVLT